MGKGKDMDFMIGEMESVIKGNGKKIKCMVLGLFINKMELKWKVFLVMMNLFKELTKLILKILVLVLS